MSTDETWRVEQLRAAKDQMEESFRAEIATLASHIALLEVELKERKNYVHFLEQYILLYKAKWTRITDDPMTFPPLGREVLMRDKSRKGPQHWLFTFKTHRTIKQLHIGHEWVAIDAIGEPVSDL